jgi:hypothetical protein
MFKQITSPLITGLLLSAVALTAHADEWVSLLDHELSQFDVWIGVPHVSVTELPEGTFQAKNVTQGTPMGANDVKRVFTMTEDNGEPMLAISGEIYGAVTTLEEYGNYHFSTQFKWGEKKWEPRLEKLRDTGILYHCTGEHGSFWSVWKSSMEYQVQETDLGDLYKLGGTSAEARTTDSIYDLKSENYASRKIRACAEPDAPHGEWNHLEIYTVGTTAVHVANGVVLMVIENMKIKDTPLSRGQIQIQCEGAEVYYKQMKIRSITEFPPEIRAQMRLRGE